MDTDFTHHVVVFMRLPSALGYVAAGALWKNQSIFKFHYTDDYLGRSDAIPVDPVILPLRDEEFSSRVLFSALRDASPDRWGRRVLGSLAGIFPDQSEDFEVLSAVHQPFRIGALAFGRTPDQPKSFASWAPPEVFVPHDLHMVANTVVQIDNLDEDEPLQTSNLSKDSVLAALGASVSLGGARPKALVWMDGESWIAKFSSCEDVWREPVIEHATMTLAAKCGINVAQTKLHEVAEQAILLVKRFDRQNGTPRHFVSAFTVTGLAEDGDWKSYQHLADQARRLGDVESGPEIFRRMVFNALCSNRDDHLRNHAFFVTRDRIVMTPAYHLVPSAIRCKSWNLSLACGLEGRAATKMNLLSSVQPFGLSDLEAGRIWDEMKAVVADWRAHFWDCGVNQAEIDELSHRFVLADS